MNRRTFLGTLTGGLLAAPLTAEAQQAVQAEVRRVGWLAMAPQPPLQAEFQRGMHELGYVDSSSWTLHERYAENAIEKLPVLAAELARLKVDVIVAEAYVAVQAARRATNAIPIVFVTGDPVSSGFVHSLARPGGHLTGIANLSLELYPKRVEILKQALPGLRRLAALQGAVSRPAVVSRVVQEAARAQGIHALPVMFVSRAEELDTAFAQVVRARADAIIVSANPFFNIHKERLIALALQHHLPALYEFREFVEAGGLICYGADMKDVYYRLAVYVDRILKGAKPADLPVEQPTKYELVINLKTAKALGLTIPPSLLQRADQVIE
jgi:putative ABC transport system substrate-binding protein